MLEILDLTLPFFAVVGIGFFAAKRGMVPANSISAINVFVFYFAMPALVAGSLARQDIGSIIDMALLAGWFAGGVPVFVLGMLFCRIYQASKGREVNIGQMAITGQAASIANVGFLALPIVAANFGDEGIRIAVAVLIVDLLIFIPFSITMLEAARSNGKRGLALFGSAVAGALRNPFAIAIILGVFLSATGIGLPGPTDRFASFLGGAAAPTALFALGLSLSQRSVERDEGYVVGLSILKLVIHPVAVSASLFLIGLDASTIAIATVVAACPVAQNVFVIAVQYQTMVQRMSAGILVSTLLAIVTVTAALIVVEV